MAHKILSINDSLHGLIEITELEKQIISNNLFNRLHDIYQNSTVYLTFPTNRTKRFEHSIGAMYLAGEMFFHALSNTDKNAEAYQSFTDDINNSLNAIIEGLSQAGGYPKNIASHLNNVYTLNKKWDEFIKKGFEDNLIDELLAMRISSMSNKPLTQSASTPNARLNNGEFIHLAIVYQSIRIAALLHDVGHPPYSHITERAIDELYSKMKDDPNNPLIKAYNECKKDTTHDQLHEMIGDKIINTIFEEILTKLATKQPDSANVFRRIFICTVWVCVMLILTDGRFNEEHYKGKIDDKLWKTLHSLIAGEVDCDRLDYIVRDSNACGIAGAQIEYKRIISGLKLCMKRPHGTDTAEYCFAFLAKSVSSLENFYLKRFSLYENAIYHHRVIKTDTLLKKVIIDLVTEYFSQNATNECNNESLLPTDNIRGLWTALNRINSSSVDNISNLIQWNDSWLITVLKNEWYKRKLAEQQKAGKTDKLADQLDEILTNEKHYFSAVKRGYDFALIDKEFKQIIAENRTVLENTDKLPLAKDFLETITASHFLRAEQKYFVLRIFDKLIWPSLSEEICRLDNRDKISPLTLLEEIISICAEKAKQIFNADEKRAIIDDVIIGLKNSKGIMDESVNLYRPFSSSDGQEQLITLEDTSNIDNVLQLFTMYSPLFYVYIKKTDDAPEQIDANHYLQILGKELGIYLINKIKEL